MGYRRRRGYSKPNYGLKAAKRHIADAQRFSGEVGHTDEVVKEAFFTLPDASLNNLLSRYGEIHGEVPEEYARQTYPKWKLYWQRHRLGSYHRWTPDAVQMSGTIAERLFALLPLLLPVREKHKIVEAIWKAYGPRSNRFIYLGPDSDPETVISAIEGHFAKQNVQYAIPRNLEERFDWLSDNDVTVKQQLLNHFMNEQKKAAIASARLNVPMMLEQMNGASAAQISKLSHTVFVGNHRVEVKVDPLRTGFILSDSPNLLIRTGVKVPWGGIGIAAAVAIGLFVTMGELNNSPSSPSQTQAATRSYQEPARALAKSNTAPPHLVSVPAATHAALPQRAWTQPPRTVAAPPAKANFTVSRPMLMNSCETMQIASVNGDGSQIITSNGKRYAVSDDAMRMQASNWATGDNVAVCETGAGSSLKVGFTSVQVSAVGSSSVEPGSCRNFYIGYTSPDGSEIGTTDGSVFQVVSNDGLKMQASNWTTGQPAIVCTARHDDTWYASVRVGFSKAQTTMTTIGSGQAQEAACSTSSVGSRPEESGRIRVGGNTYRIDNEVMQMSAEQFVTGNPVVLCKYSANGVMHASIAKGFSRVQATEL